ncbi:MAG TPA: PEP-utilizing enzyme, partial [Candidatus Norongarragalinales archaeon]|nr:PEP-utilizing enzyme [Candidatus Norongarragalinales archaeon]
ILTPSDLPKMGEGDILVAQATNPDVVPAMKKAAAIVTNTGGITCHAAIVSRELGIPCIVGTKIATDVLKDGMVVEVDATKGIVKILKK